MTMTRTDGQGSKEEKADMKKMLAAYQQIKPALDLAADEPDPTQHDAISRIAQVDKELGLDD